MLIYFFQTTILNKHLQEIMEGLTAKVFRTYNASRTLEEQLDLLTNGMFEVHKAVVVWLFYYRLTKGC